LGAAPPLLTFPPPLPRPVGTGPPQRRGGPSPGVTRRRPQPAARSVQRHLRVRGGESEGRHVGVDRLAGFLNVHAVWWAVRGAYTGEHLRRCGSSFDAELMRPYGELSPPQI